MKPETARKVIIICDICMILSLLGTILFLWYFVEPMKVAANPFYAVSKIPGAYCTINGIPEMNFVKPENISQISSKIIIINTTRLNFTG